MRKIGIVAISLDGCITKHQSEGVTFTSLADQRYFRQILKTFDCQLLGSKTFEASQALLLKSLAEEHLRIVWTRNPTRFQTYAVDGSLEFRSGDLKAIFAELETRNKKHCAILGGASVYTACIQQDLMDEFWVTVEPLGFGVGKRLFETAVDFRFALLAVENLSQDTLLLKYKVL